jgi:hypothetical protein
MIGGSMSIEYKFNEKELLKQVSEYIDSTYTNHHYSKNRIQTTEFIADSGHLVGFAAGSIIKYTQRYGHKGGQDDWRKDLMKTIHCAIIMLSEHDRLSS